MLKKRVIFTLLLDDDSFMLSRNFRLQRVGNLEWLQKNYNFSKIAFSIDELIVLDVSRDRGKESNIYDYIQQLADGCFVPIAAGGGIRSMAQARRLLRSGADKIVINSLVGANPEIIGEMASEFGRQCIVVAVDVKKENQRYSIYTENGCNRVEASLSEWLNAIVKLPVGEIYLNSIDRDGTGQGYDLELLDHLPYPMPIPIIMGGGAGYYSHLAEGLSQDKIDAVATAHLFNFVGDGLYKAREELLQNGFTLSKWDPLIAIKLHNIFKNITPL
jgi:imidazole glycerol-phosphate synthase subunit HisF